MDMKKLLDEFLGSVGKCRKHLPEQGDAFLNLAKSVVGKEGALDKKTKRLIALALSVASGCGWCVAYHVDGAFKEGATKEEIIEGAYVAVLMNGGPSLAHMNYVFDAVEQLK